VARRDTDGYIAYIGRTDDVFKASDYKISPFELESVLIEHPAVVEAAVVPAPDPTRLAVPKAYISLATGVGSRSGHGRRDFRPCSAKPCALSTHPAHRIHGTTQDYHRQDPTCRVAISRKCLQAR
jgi:acyl-coenzyme A synthetase/AMP-(fatty) acid ligase